MASGPSARANAAQLQRDLSSGAPIPYRRVPGNVRRYYNPRTGEEVSEHYVVRVYRPRLSEIERAETQRQVRVATSNQIRQRNSIASTWMTRQAYLGSPVTSRNQALKNAEFQRLYQRLRVVSYEARQTPLEDSAARAAVYANDGEYAQLLVELGRRRPNEAFPVGESALAVGEGGSYINEIVLPSMQVEYPIPYG